MKTKMFFPVVAMALALFGFSSCWTQHGQNVTINRTVLLYIAGDNSLDDYAYNNIKAITESIGNPDNYGARLVAYVDRLGRRPFLAEIHRNSVDTLKVYPEEFSSDPTTLANVINEVATTWPSERYGLVLWSHGTGWVPTDLLNTVAFNMGYVRGADGRIPEGAVWEPSGETKAFGYESDSSSKNGYICMDIEDLAAAIPDNMFDFLIFDACYMGGVEIAYALKDKAKQIVSSAYEIVGDGFPYQSLTQFILKGDMLTVCEDFYNFYNSQTGWKQMGGVSLVNTAYLDSLALAFSNCIKGHEEDIRNFNLIDIQRFDRFRYHVMFDMKEFVEKVCTDEKLLEEFNRQLDNCIPYARSTKYMFKGELAQLQINHYCGLSMFIPVKGYDGKINDAYRKTLWSQKTGF